MADFGGAAFGECFSDGAADVERAFDALALREVEAVAGSAGGEAAVDLVFDFDADFGAATCSVNSQ